jgi:hypothetical protein
VRQDFPLRRAWWALPFVLPLSPARTAAVLTDDAVSIRMGLLGRAEIPLRLVDRIGTARWPWWAGVGVRLVRGTVAFVPDSGTVAQVELSEQLKVRAPLPWRVTRVLVAVEDVPGFIEAVAQARRAV